MNVVERMRMMNDLNDDVHSRMSFLPWHTRIKIHVYMTTWTLLYAAIVLVETLMYPVRVAQIKSRERMLERWLKKDMR